MASSDFSDVATRVEHLLETEFKSRKLDPKTAPLYAQMLVGMVALTSQWWLESRRFKKDEVAEKVAKEEAEPERIASVVDAAENRRSERFMGFILRRCDHRC